MTDRPTTATDLTRSAFARVARGAVFALLFAITALAAAQAIGDDVSSFLGATGAVEGDADTFVVGDLVVDVEAPADILAGITLSGSLDDQGLQDAASTLAIATGYGAGIEEPLLAFLRDRAPEFAGQGPVRISVEAYVLELVVADDALSDVTLGLSLPRIDEERFGPPAATLGDPDAPVTIRVFSDFQCPFCRRYALEVMPGVETGPLEEGTANFAFHHFPLTSIHANAVPAAEAAQCVIDRIGVDAFWPYHDEVFERLDAWQGLGDPEPYFARLARDVTPLVQEVAERDGLDAAAAGDAAVAEIEACQQAGETREVVRAALDVARQLGLNGTPSVFVGGYKLNDFGNPQAYARLIRLAGAEASAAQGE